jgi:SpoVK/Ycf46/Vps4 family AAA+-type ATPase
LKQLSTFVDYITALARSGTQVVQVRTTERRRVMRDLQTACLGPLAPGKEPLWQLVSWGLRAGFSDASKQNSLEPMAGNPVAALEAVVSDRFTRNTDEILDKPSRTTGLVTDIYTDSESGLCMVVVGEAIHDLPPGTGPAVSVGQSVKLGQNLCRMYSSNGIFIFHDMADITSDMFVRATLRDLYEEQKLSHGLFQRMLVLLGPVPVRHPELDYLITHVAYELPDQAQLEQAVTYVAAGCPGSTGVVSTDFRKELAGAMTGFSQSEAHDALAFLAYACDGFRCATDENEPEQDKQKQQRAHEEVMLRQLHRRQREAWATDEVLELYDLETVAGFETVGGFDNFKDWALRVAACYSERARSLGIEPFKGCLLGGPAGTAKSLAALILAKELRLPLIDFNISRVFNSLVGASEATMDGVLGRIKAKGPAVVRVDEADKALGGIAQNQGGDSGVGIRVLGRFLSWLANENNQALVVMTLNSVDGLPRELLRKGRFDKIWFTDLPTEEEAVDILRIHLRKRGLDAMALVPDNEAAQYAAIMKASGQLVGAEIEQAVKDARVEAMFRSGGTHATPDIRLLQEILRGIRPTVKTTADAVREAFEGQAEPVARQKTVARPPRGQRTVRVGGTS